MSEHQQEAPRYSEDNSPIVAAILTKAHCGLVRSGMSDEEADRKVRSVFLRYYNLLFESGAVSREPLEPWLRPRPQSD